MKLAILIKGGMVQEILGDFEIEEIHIVDADFVCCKPDEQWNDLKKELKQLYEKQN